MAELYDRSLPLPTFQGTRFSVCGLRASGRRWALPAAKPNPMRTTPVAPAATTDNPGIHHPTAIPAVHIPAPSQTKDLMPYSVENGR